MVMAHLVAQVVWSMSQARAFSHISCTEDSRRFSLFCRDPLHTREFMTGNSVGLLILDVLDRNTQT